MSQGSASHQGTPGAALAVVGGRWKIDPRASGTAVVAKAVLDDLHAIVVIGGGGHSSGALTNRVRELLADAREAPESAVRRPIPPAMQRAIQSLLEWAEDVEQGSPGVSFSAIVFLDSETSPVAAHVGGSEPVIETEAGLLSPQSMLLRGSGGAQARALRLLPGRLPSVSLIWSSESPESKSGAGATVEAQWNLEPAETDPETPEADTAAAEFAAAEIATEIAAEPETPPNVTPAAEVAREFDVAQDVDVAPAAEAVAAMDAAPAVDPEPVADIASSSEPALGITRSAEPAHAADTAEAEGPANTGSRPALGITRSLDAAPPAGAAVPAASDSESALGITRAFEFTPPADVTPPADSSPALDIQRTADVTPAADANAHGVLDAILEDADELPGRQFSVSYQQASQAELGRSSLLQDIEDAKRSMSDGHAAASSVAPDEVTDDDGARAGDEDETEHIPWLDAASPASDDPDHSSRRPTEAHDQDAIARAREAHEAYGPKSEAAAPLPEQAPADSPPVGSTPQRRPARPLVWMKAKESTVVETEPAPKSKRPRPRIARPKIGPTPVLAPAQPAQAGTPQAAARPDPKRNALLVGALVIVALVVAFKLASRSHEAKPDDGTQEMAHVIVPPAPGEPATTVTGDVAIRATIRKDDNVTPLKGARIWIDGQARAAVPAILTLTRGPHSIRVTDGETDAPVQLVEVTGEHMQMSNFEFGTTDRMPRLVLLNHEGPGLLSRVATITAFLESVANEDLQDMTLNVEEAGVWNAVPMSLLPAPGGTVGVAVLNAERMRGTRLPRMYVGATQTSTGARYFTEIQNSEK